MKKLLLLFIWILAVAGLNAQNYKITFSGSGAVTTVNTVKAENLTRGKSVILNGNDTLFLSSPVGIGEIKKDNDLNINIHPNPVNGIAFIDFMNYAKGSVCMAIYDLAGKNILINYEQLSEGRHSYSLSGMPAGIYLMKIETGNDTYVSRIVSASAGSGVAKLQYQSSFPVDDIKDLYSASGGNSGLKSIKASSTLEYSNGDIIKLTGKSGDYETISMLDPTKTTAVGFIFETCRDGGNNLYPVVKIGNQSWMGSNLRTSKYIDGTDIPLVTSGTEWGPLSTPGYCLYNNGLDFYLPEYGALYNWYAVNTKKLCPTGWHVPSDEEWAMLITYLGGEMAAGGKLKSTGTSHWFNPNSMATNETGFTGLPGGLRDGGGIFYGTKGNGYWWTSTQSTTGTPNAYNRSLYDGNGLISRQLSHKGYGYSVRCVKDAAK